MQQFSDTALPPAEKRDLFAAAGESHKGLARRKNEDNFSLVYSADRRLLLAVVADGIGGHSRGEMASYICCRELTCAFMKKSENIRTSEEAAAFLQEELSRINEAVYLRNRSNRSLRRPMGTTVNCVIFLPGKVVMANAGDSRFYEFFASNSFRQLSTDHSFKAVVENKEKKSSVPRSGSVIYRAVGLHRNFELELKTFDILSGSRYLLCTDGLYRFEETEKIAQMITQADLPRQAVNGFMRTALIAGGLDNITGIAVFVNGEGK